jgi:formate dehydrogenase maturation protein FdhE
MEGKHSPMELITAQETQAEKQQRWREYIEDLITSKHEEMKRKLLDLVDNIHKQEMEELEEDLKKVSTDMKEWQRKCEEPVNFEVFVVSKIR